MKITRRQLRRIIKEETRRLNEVVPSDPHATLRKNLEEFMKENGYRWVGGKDDGPIWAFRMEGDENGKFWVDVMFKTEGA